MPPCSAPSKIPTAAAPFVRSRAGFRWDRVGPVVLALAAVFLVVALWSLLRPAPPRPVLRVSVSLPDEQQLTALGQFDVSADGALMVYHGPGDGGVPRLWARRWDALDATPIRDTDGANGPAISPDGLEVAFLFGLSLRVVPVQGRFGAVLRALEPRWGVALLPAHVLPVGPGPVRRWRARALGTGG
jgi:hypothetical protein